MARTEHTSDGKISYKETSGEEAQRGRRSRVADPGRRKRGTMQRLEVAMGLVGTITILALFTLVMACVEASGAALVASIVIFLVAAVVLAVLAVWYYRLK